MLAGVCLAALLANALPASPQQAGGVQASEPKYRVIRSMTGSKGSEQGGTYIIEDPRTVFYVPDDRQVIVHFEWEGPPGKHQFEGLWKNPDGKVVAISDFTFEAKARRFGGYWSLAISENIKTGFWALEARINGESAGSHSFQIISAAKPGDLAVSRRMLAPNEVYQKALLAMVSIEKLDASGDRAGTSTGFFLDSKHLLTTFQSIDGAGRVRLVFPSGKKVETAEVLAWSRHQDWAVLPVADAPSLPLRLATEKKWTIGDRCYTLDVPAESNRVIVEGSIIGQNTFGNAGDRLNLSFSVNREAFGSPVLDEYGDVIAILGASIVPGAISDESGFLGFVGIPSRVGSVSRGVLAAPIELVNLKGKTSAKLFAELQMAGEFTPLVKPKSPVQYGWLGGRVNNRFGTPIMEDIRSQFTRSDKELAVIINWKGREKKKDAAILRLFDGDNRFITETRPVKVSLKPNQETFATWKMTFQPNVKAGIYRLDLVYGADTVWRTFFRIVE